MAQVVPQQPELLQRVRQAAVVVQFQPPLPFQLFDVQPGAALVLPDQQRCGPAQHQNHRGKAPQQQQRVQRKAAAGNQAPGLHAQRKQPAQAVCRDQTDRNPDRQPPPGGKPGRQAAEHPEPGQDRKKPQNGAGNLIRDKRYKQHIESGQCQCQFVQDHE